MHAVPHYSLEIKKYGNKFSYTHKIINISSQCEREFLLTPRTRVWIQPCINKIMMTSLGNLFHNIFLTIEICMICKTCDTAQVKRGRLLYVASILRKLVDMSILSMAA